MNQAQSLGRTSPISVTEINTSIFPELNRQTTTPLASINLDEAFSILVDCRVRSMRLVESTRHINLNNIETTRLIYEEANSISEQLDMVYYSYEMSLSQGEVSESEAADARALTATIYDRIQPFF